MQWELQILLKLRYFSGNIRRDWCQGDENRYHGNSQADSLIDNASNLWHERNCLRIFNTVLKYTLLHADEKIYQHSIPPPQPTRLSMTFPDKTSLVLQCLRIWDGERAPEEVWRVEGSLNCSSEIKFCIPLAGITFVAILLPDLWFPLTSELGIQLPMYFRTTCCRNKCVKSEVSKLEG